MFFDQTVERHAGAADETAGGGDATANPGQALQGALQFPRGGGGLERAEPGFIATLRRHRDPEALSRHLA